MQRRSLLSASAGAALAAAQTGGKVTHYMRYRRDNEMRGGLFDGSRGSAKHKLADVKLLYLCEPKQVLAVDQITSDKN